jgi:hypothetical protein
MLWTKNLDLNLARRGYGEVQRQPVSFRDRVEENTSKLLFWVVNVVNAPREMRDVRLATGSSAASCG